MSFFGKEEQSHLGIDIGAGGIKLVELRKTKDRPQLWTYGIAEQDLDIHLKDADETPKQTKKENGEIILPEEQEKQEPKEKIELDDPRIGEISDLLKNLLKQANVKAKKATASLPVSYVFHTVVTLPEVDKEDREEIIRAKVDKLISRPVDEMQVVHQEVPQENEDKDYVKYLVTAAPKDLVRFYTAIFQKAGLQLQELETEAFSLQRSLVGDDPATVLVVDIGVERTNFFIMDQGLPMTHRSIEVGGDNINKILKKVMGIEDENTTQIKKDISHLPEKDVDPKLFNQITEPIIKEIEYGFDLYSHQVGNEDKKPEKIILTGGSSFFPAISRKLKEHFQMKVFVGDPWARVVYQQGLKPILDNLGPRMTVSIGLALRNIV